MEIAIQLFANQGYHATSIQDILNQSDISKGELFQASLLFTEE